MIIDAHVHVWQPGDGHRVLIRERVAGLDRDFGFDRLAPLLPSAGVAKVVLVSAAQSFAETERLLAVADRHSDLVAGVIGFLDLEAEDFDARLEAAARHAALAGLRLPLVVQDDTEWIRRPRVGEALGALAERRLVAQVLAGPKHLAACAEVLAGHKNLNILLDHCGNPGPDHVADFVWRDGLAAIAERTSAFCKVGDFSLPAGPLADVARCDAVFGHVLDCFGPERLIYGSNWPVSTLQQAYPEVIAGLHATARRAGLDPNALDRAMTTNAARLCGGRHRPGGG